MTVIGALERSTTDEDGVRWPWTEYLLYHPTAGFRWLVESSGHWSYVVPLAAGDAVDEGTVATYAGKKFRLFDDAPATVDHVDGEFYWKVAIGERVEASDYVRPPEMISFEKSESEVTVSHGTYLPRAEVARLFGIADLPRAEGVGAHQPFTHKAVYLAFAALAAVALVVLLVDVGRSRSVGGFTKSWSIEAQKSADEGQVVFTDPFQLSGRKRIAIDVEVPLDNSWAYVQGDLVEERTGAVQWFDVPVEYYHGSDEDGSWSEGSQSARAVLPSTPGGTYTLRLELQREKWQQPSPGVWSVRLEEGVARPTFFLALLGGLALVPLLVALRHRWFEKERWDNSSMQSGGGDDE
jgi:hypothetical protein